MADRLDEALAQGKRALGELLGDEEMASEGTPEAERARPEPEAGGSLDRDPDELGRRPGEADAVRGGAIDDPGMGEPSRRVEGDIRRAG